MKKIILATALISTMLFSTGCGFQDDIDDFMDKVFGEQKTSQTTNESSDSNQITVIHGNPEVLDAQVLNGTQVDEYSVYSAVLNSEVLTNRAAQVAVGAMTVSDFRGTALGNRSDPLSYVQQRIPGLGLAILGDFHRKNMEAIPMISSFQTRLPCVLLSAQEEDEVLKRNSWTAFQNRFPRSQGLTRFSRVGFDPGVTVAFLYAGIEENAFSSTRYFLYLRKGIQGNWVIEAKVRI